MSQIQLTLDEIIERLNSMVEADSEAVMALIISRVPCNNRLADHPTCQVDTIDRLGVNDGINRVGLLGVLNGILGIDANGWGPLCAEIDDNGKLIRFNISDGAKGVHKLLADFMGAEMAKAVLGQTLTVEAGQRGARSLGEVHDRVLNEQ